MERFVIEGGHPLRGEVTASGNKNAAPKMLAACLLTDQPVTLTNVPDITDVHAMIAILRHLGAEIEQVDAHIVRVTAANIRTSKVPLAEARAMRSSVVLAGPLLGRTGNVELPPPGGDVIGRRRLDTHVLALERLGAHVDYEGGVFRMNADGLSGADMLLDEASVTATENAVLAAALAKGTSVIRHAAQEPHVQNLCHMLAAMGAQVDGIGSSTITIEGSDKLHGAEVRVGADYLEVGSFIGAAVVTGGEITIHEADPEYFPMIALTFEKLGVRWDVQGSSIFVPAGQDLTISREIGNRIPVIKAQPWPSFPTDLMSIAITVATQASGTVLFHEWMYDGRLFFTDKLVSMGARITLCDPHRALVSGPAALRGVPNIASPDIRAGIAILLAALAARGTTIIDNVWHIDRSYERVEHKLNALGAHIERVGG